MAANILSSREAVQTSVFVVRAFVKMREVLSGHKELAEQLVALERYLEEYADAEIARERFNDPHTKILTARQMREKVGV